MFIVLVLVVSTFIFQFVQQIKDRNKGEQQEEIRMMDAQAEARRWIERLGSEVLTTSGTDEASTSLIGTASERYNSAQARLGSAQTPRQAELAGEIAIEGLHFMRDARLAMGMPAGPDLPQLSRGEN